MSEVERLSLHTVLALASAPSTTHDGLDTSVIVAFDDLLLEFEQILVSDQVLSRLVEVVLLLRDARPGEVA
jgi:hypothetical protein